jgi:hypothetical protein
MKLGFMYTAYLVANMAIGLLFMAMIYVNGLLGTYDLSYGILTLIISVWGLARTFKSSNEGKISAGVQHSWLLVSFAIGYISLALAPVFTASLAIVAFQSLLSAIQAVWGSFLLVQAYRSGYSIIRV